MNWRWVALATIRPVQKMLQYYKKEEILNIQVMRYEHGDLVFDGYEHEDKGKSQR